MRGQLRLRILLAVVLCAGVLPALMPAAPTVQAAPEPGAWSAAGRMATERRSHTATLLPNGKVLVAGGQNRVSIGLSSVELYDPSTRSWLPASPMSVGRSVATATLLNSGKVLVVGGWSGSEVHRSAELYDPITNAWSPAASMSVARFHHRSVLLSDGRVLVMGGYAFRADGGCCEPHRSAELYDPITNAWSPAAKPSYIRAQEHTLTLLGNGQVLAAGGVPDPMSAELYDPSTDSWTRLPDMRRRHGAHTATLLPDGRVLVAGSGGLDGDFVEIFDQVARTWTSANTMTDPRGAHTATLLPDGTVLVVGGDPGGFRGEVYDSATDVWTPTPLMAESRANHTATLLPDGTVLVVGGNRSFFSIETRATAELYTPGGAPLAGTITAQQFKDLNANGQRDGNEPPLAGWVVTLHEGGCTGKQLGAGVTDSRGNTTFSGLAMGSYSVKTAPPAGQEADWVPTTGASRCQTISLSAGESRTVSFGDRRAWPEPDDYRFLASLKFPWCKGDKEPRLVNDDWDGHWNRPLPGASGIALDIGKSGGGALVQGTPILAPMEGRVIKPPFDAAGYGNYVIIDSGSGWQVLLAHLLYPSSAKSQVRTGDYIGLLGGSGRSTGPHIHVEILWYGGWNNPPTFDETNITSLFGQPPSALRTGKELTSTNTGDMCAPTLFAAAQTSLVQLASAGTTTLDVGSTSDFSIGDAIRINPGGANQEDNLVVGFGSFILGIPLESAHQAQEPVVKIVRTPPTTTAAPAPPPTAAGWHNTDVAVTLNASPASFGVAATYYAVDNPDCRPSAPDNCLAYTGPFTISAQGTHTVSYFSGNRLADFESLQSQEVRIDRTQPAISFDSRTPANVNGWNNADVMVTWSCADTLSGPTALTVSQVVTGEGDNLSATGTCSDRAGNTASDTQTGIKIDRTPPTVAVTGVTQGAVYTLGAVPAAGCSTSDTLAGVAAQATLSRIGGTANGVGSFTAICSGGMDRAGNTRSPVSVAYTVQYKFTGFFAPVDAPPTINTTKAGSTVPLKWSLNGVSALSSLVSIEWRAVDCGSLVGSEELVDSAPTGGTAFRYDVETGQFIYNLATNAGWAGTCRQVVVMLDDGTSHIANFKLK